MENPHRREFLKALVGAALGTAIESSARAETPASPLESRAALEEARALERRFKPLDAALKTILAETVPPAPRSGLEPYQYATAKEQLMARSRALRTFGPELNAFEDALKDSLKRLAAPIASLRRSEPGVSGPDSAYQRTLASVYHSLRTLQLHGLWYRAAIESGVYDRAALLVPDAEEITYRYSARVGDCLPHGKDVLDEDIDPLVNWSFAPDAHDPRAGAPWREAGKRREFRRVLDEPEVQDFFKDHPELPWSGAFSLVKSVIEYRERMPAAAPLSDIFKKMFAERQIFAGRVIADKATTLVRFHGVDPSDARMFSPATFDRLSPALGIPSHHDHVFDARRDAAADTKFVAALQENFGPTLIVADTHGRAKKWAGVGKKTIDVARVAAALGKRIQAVAERDGFEKARVALADTTIVGAPCYARDFLFVHLMPEIGRVLAASEETIGFSPDMLVPPQIISLGQQGDPIFERLSAQLDERLERWKRTKAITGEDMLEIEPYLYGVGGDMSIASQVPGSLYQISQKMGSKPTNDSAV